MHPLFSQELAHAHIKQLQDKAHAERQAAIAQQNIGVQHISLLERLQQLLHWKNLSSRHTAVGLSIETDPLTAIAIKPALAATFSTLYDEGMVSAYDERFIERFTQTLEQELAHRPRFLPS